MSDVWLKVKLPVDLHEKFRRWTFNNDTSMQETVVKLLNDWVGRSVPVKRDVVEVDTKGSALGERALRAVEADAPKPMQVSNPAVPTIPKTSPYVGEVPMAKCQKCFDVFPVTTLVTDHKTGKKFCENCVENMRNGQ